MTKIEAHPKRPAPDPKGSVARRVIRCESYIEQNTGDLIAIMDYADGTGQVERTSAAELRRRHGAERWAN